MVFTPLLTLSFSHLFFHNLISVSPQSVPRPTLSSCFLAFTIHNPNQVTVPVWSDIVNGKYNMSLCSLWITHPWVKKWVHQMDRADNVVNHDKILCVNSKIIYTQHFNHKQFHKNKNPLCHCCIEPYLPYLNVCLHLACLVWFAQAKTLGSVNPNQRAFAPLVQLERFYCCCRHHRPWLTN